MSDESIEQEIQAKGANVAPRITPADVEANIENHALLHWRGRAAVRRSERSGRFSSQ